MAGQPDKYASCMLDGEKYMFVFNHEGRWAAEDLLNREWPSIVFAYNTGNAGSRVQAALLFAVTRKHHARELPDARSMMRLLDKLDAAEEDESTDFAAALHAAITGTPKREILEEIEKRRAEAESLDEEESLDEDEEEPDSEAGPKGEAEPDEAGNSEPSKTTKRSSGSRSGTGKSSS